MDQCIFVMLKNNVKDGGIDLIDNTKAIDEFYEWRKHADLQGYMELLYLAKGGKRPARDNFCLVELNEEDICQLEQAVENDGLPYTVGFFFGKSNEDKTEQTLKFIQEAKLFYAKQENKEPDRKQTLIYWCSW